MKLETAYEDVKLFQKTFDHPVGEFPQRLTEERKAARLSWMQEELDEYKEASTVHDEADALIDALYFIFGTFVEMGVNPAPLFDIVQKANMAKLFPDGTVHRRPEDGKVIKPPDWVAPEPQLIEEITRQMAEALAGLKEVASGQ
jgi:predicted HAD superfamily Cof-like phosphohydrolase